MWVGSIIYEADAESPQGPEADEASNAFSGLNNLCNSETPLAQTLCGLNPHLDSFHKQLGQMCDIIGANLSSASFYLRH